VNPVLRRVCVKGGSREDRRRSLSSEFKLLHVLVVRSEKTTKRGGGRWGNGKEGKVKGVQGEGR